MVSSASPLVLILDDDQATLDLYRDLLTDVGYRVSLLNRPPDDLVEVERLRPDLLMLDLIFAGEDDGWRFFQALKRHEATEAIPVLVCTAAVGLVEELREQLEEWSCGIVLKPFDIDRLLAALGFCLESPRRDRAAG